MRSPFFLCKNFLSALTNADRYKILKNCTDFLTRLAPVLTLVIIVLLTYYTEKICNEKIYVQTVFTQIIKYYFMIEIFGNWALFYITKSFIDKSPGNSELAQGLSHSDCRELRYCPICKIYKPERSHHCSLCDRCIHQRDHHCFFLGTCVGGYNLCYFIFFCFHACLGCLYAASVLHKHYSGKYLRFFFSSEFHYYFYPVTLVHWLNGKAELAEVGWVTLLYVAIATAAFTAFCICQQLFFILRGQTAYEYNKGLLMVHRSACNNFTHVFGRYWMISLLVPLPRYLTSSTHRSFLKLV